MQKQLADSGRCCAKRNIYNEKGQMLTAAHGSEKPTLTNEYFIDGYIKGQTLSDGRVFRYAYSRELNVVRENQITDPNGLETTSSA
jgi:uncharacterized protein RhaS with RHS repeats